MNRPPNAPTPLGPANAWNPPVISNPGQRVPSVRLSWRDNGDPDGDALAFWVHINRWNATTRSWQTVFRGYAPERNGFTFQRQHGLADVGHYQWTVVAGDPARRSNPAGAACPWQHFMATLALE